MHTFFDLVTQDEQRMRTAAAAREAAAATLGPARADLSSKLTARIGGLNVVAELALTADEQARLGDAVVTTLEEILRARAVLGA